MQTARQVNEFRYPHILYWNTHLSQIFIDWPLKAENIVASHFKLHTDHRMSHGAH